MYTASMEVDAEVDLGSLWRELLTDPQSPERFELTERGEVVVSPLPTNRHQRIVGRVAAQLLAQLGSEVLYELAVLTPSAGVRRPDVAWLPLDQIGESPLPDPLEKAPPLVVEVLSPGVRSAGMLEKIRGYIEAGAIEVVIVGLRGEVAFHRADGVHPESKLGLRLELSPALFR